MAAVYGNSILSIFVLSPQNSAGGCRVNAHNKWPMQASRYCDINTGGGRIRLFESAPKQWHIEYGDDTYKHGKYSTHNPFRTRAWTLQERELSEASTFLPTWCFGNVVLQKFRVRSLGKDSIRQMTSFHGQFETILPRALKSVDLCRFGPDGMSS
jgi:hypothetical protein